jgi:hypothetical protein
MPPGGGGFPDFFGLSDRTRVVGSDGTTALHEALRGAEGTILAHIDPYDPWAAGPSGLSALDLARELISLTVSVMYWYGYSNPSGGVGHSTRSHRATAVCPSGVAT